MKTTMKILVVIVAFMLIMQPKVSRAEGIESTTSERIITGVTAENDDVNDGLLLMREEEKLAHDLYQAFFDLYEMRIFSNISSSEANHMEAVLGLLKSAGLEDPATDEAGVFSNAELQDAYDGLLSSGKTSLVDALKSGAYVEELDIRDLQEQLNLVEDESIKVVYSNLLRASGNHLRAFNRVLANNGVDYEPQLLSQETFNGIVNSESEQGRKGRRGGQCGCGQGAGCKNK